MADDNLFTITQAAKRLGVDAGGRSRKGHRLGIPTQRVGRKAVRFSWDAFEAATAPPADYVPFTEVVARAGLARTLISQRCAELDIAIHRQPPDLSVSLIQIDDVERLIHHRRLSRTKSSPSDG